MIAFQVAGKATHDALFLFEFSGDCSTCHRSGIRGRVHCWDNVVGAFVVLEESTLGRIDSCRQRSTSLDDEHCLVVNALFLADLPQMIVVFRRVFQ